MSFGFTAQGIAIIHYVLNNQKEIEIHIVIILLTKVNISMKVLIEENRLQKIKFLII